MRWAIRSVGIWVIVGLILGAIFGNIMVSVLESVSDSPEGMGFEMARIVSPVAGALWGLVAGSIGAVIAFVSHSSVAYSSFMAAASVAPFGYYAYQHLVDYDHVVPMGLTVVIGIVIWAIARRFDSPAYPDSDADQGQISLA